MREYIPKFRTKYAGEETPIITYTKRQLTENCFDDMVLFDSSEVIYDSWLFSSFFINSFMSLHWKIEIKNTKYTIRLYYLTSKSFPSFTVNTEDLNV